jgi:putative SOS response-associated peptidase YedK
MCTRFYVEPAYYAPIITRAQKLKLADDMMRHLGKPLTMSGEMRQTDVTAVLAPNKEGNVSVFPMIWGFSHEATDAPIGNCRLETASQKEMWKDSWFRRRCVIPCSWYFEWEHFRSPDGKRSKVGDKYLIQPKDSHTTMLAGLYRFEERNGLQVPVFSVLTRDAVGELRGIHDRMPLMINKDDAEDWIKPNGSPGDISKRAITNVVIEKATG